MFLLDRRNPFHNGKFPRTKHNYVGSRYLAGTPMSLYFFPRLHRSMLLTKTTGLSVRQIDLALDKVERNGLRVLSKYPK